MYCKCYLNLHHAFIVLKDYSAITLEDIMVKNFVCCMTILLGLISGTLAADLDSARIDELTGLKGKFNDKEGVYKVTFPRNDVKVVVDAWMMPPFMGLGTWAAFTKGAHTEAMVMGDTVLFEDEVNAAMSAALDNGLSVTALHNHFFFDHPKVYFMHIEGEGAVDQLAGAVRKVYDSIKPIRAASPQPKDSVGNKSLPEKNSISGAPLNEVFERQGESKDGMVKFTVGRPAKMHDVAIDKDMGVNTWAAFAGSDDNAIVDGDFVVTEDELQPVLRSLLKDKINIVAIHQHMTHEQPRMMFFHYWGRGRAKDLANAIKGGFLISGLTEVSSPMP
ncbi:MAG: DUF1259 domain-containing protein [Chthoniobacterales bacterium]